MIVQVIVGAVLGLVVLAGVVVLVLRGAPEALVADKLPENLHSGADEVDELVTGSDGVDEAGFDDLVGGEGGLDDRVERDRTE